MEENANWQSETLTDLAIVALELEEDEFEFLADAATKIACAVCQDYPQFVVLKLFRSRTEEEPDSYKIIFSKPLESSDSVRHGSQETGKLFFPEEKKALVKAMREKEVVIVNQVAKNCLATYMRKHALKKGIQHMAIVPVDDIEGETGWLFVFDRVKCEKEFGEEERIFLEQCAKIMTMAIRRRRKEIRDRRMAASIKSRDLLSSVEHIVRNPLNILGLASKRAKAAIEKQDYLQARTYIEIANQSNRRIMKDMELLEHVASFLKTGSNSEKEIRPLAEYLEAFSDQQFMKKVDVENVNLNHSIRLVSDLISLVRDYMLGNKNGEDKMVIETKHVPEKNEVEITFHCSGFRKSKAETEHDMNIYLIAGIAETLEGGASVEDGTLRIFLPLAKKG